MSWSFKIKSCQALWISMLSLKSSCKALACFESNDETLIFASGPVVYRCVYDRVREFCGESKQSVESMLIKIRNDGMPYSREIIARDSPCYAVRIEKRYHEIARHTCTERHEEPSNSIVQSQICLNQGNVWFARPARRQIDSDDCEISVKYVEYSEKEARLDWR